jgi:S1-C subfamily serine protease
VGHEGCGAASEVGLIPQCDKDPDSMFLSVHCEVQPGRRKPPVRKTQLPTSRAVTTGIVGATLLILSIFASSRVLAGANLKVLVPHHSVGIIRERETLRPYGSGFLLDDVNYMVTAWHVVFDKSTHLQRKLVFQPMTRLGIHDPAPFLEMKPYFLSEERDIAVMRLEGKNLAKEPLVRGNAASLRPGDMVGYGGLNLRDSILTFTLSGDSITNIFTKGDLRFLEIRGIAIPGFSGGPLFGGGETVVGIILRGDIPADPDGKSRFEAATVEQIPQFVSTGKKPK